MILLLGFASLISLYTWNIAFPISVWVDFGVWCLLVVSLLAALIELVPRPRVNVGRIAGPMFVLAVSAFALLGAAPLRALGFGVCHGAGEAS